MQTSRPKICVISATPLSVYFFFTEHLRQMSQWADITLVYNKNYNAEVQPIDAPVIQKHIKIHRRVALFDDLKGLISLSYFFYRNQFDMVITLTPKAGLLGMIAACLTKVHSRLHIFQGEVWSSMRGLNRYLFRSADRITARLSTGVLAVSDSERQYLVDESVVHSDMIDVIGAGSISGVDCDRFRPNKNIRVALRDHLNISQTSIVVLFVGRITEDKGVFELVRVFSRLAVISSDTFLLIVGPDENNLKDQLQALVGVEFVDRLKFIGFTREPEKYMAASDILCLPSYREGFGSVALEAASCQLPVVASDIHGLQDAVCHQKTGLLVPVGNENALFNALSCLTLSPNLREAFGRHGRSRVLAQFQAKNVITGYVNYFRKSLIVNENC